MIFRIMLSLTLIATSCMIAGTSVAQGNSGKGAKSIPPGQIQRQLNGKIKPIPPGQIKRYTRGDILPRGVSYVNILDLSKWKLKPLNNGNHYIRIDDQILEVSKDFRTVVEAVGIVSQLLL